MKDDLTGILLGAKVNKWLNYETPISLKITTEEISKLPLGHCSILRKDSHDHYLKTLPLIWLHRFYYVT